MIEVMKLMPKNDKGSACFADIERFVAEADSTKAAELMALPGSFHGTLDVGALLVLPKCYVMVSKTMEMASYAISRTLIPNKASQLELLEKILNQEPLPNTGGHASISIMHKILQHQKDAAGSQLNLNRYEESALVSPKQCT